SAGIVALLARLRPYTRPYRRYLWVIAGGLVLGLPLAWARPFLVKRVFDDAVPRGDLALLGRLALVFAALIVVEAWFATGRGYATTLFHHRMIQRLRLDLFRRFQRLRLGAWSARGAGQWTSRLADDVQQLGGVTGDHFAAATAAAIQALVSATILLALEPPLAVYGLLGAAFLLGLQAFFNRPLRRRSAAVGAAVEAMSDDLQQAVTGAATVRGAAAESREARRYARALGAVIRTSLGRDLFGLWSGHPSIVLGGIFSTGLLLFGAARIARGEMTQGDLFAAFGLFGQMFDAVHRLGAMNPSFQRSIAALERVVEVLDQTAIDRQPTGRYVPATLRGDVVFEHVDFGYGPRDAGGEQVLFDVSFEARAGETVALVGRSGAGKSTLAALLPRFHEPWSGRILLDGRPLSDYDVIELRKRIGVVSQDVFLFNRTAAENLAYGDPDATPDRIRAAAEAADAHEFLAALPQGYDTKLGDRGVRLSAGQRQRLSIARELLRDPRLIVLDEATAWLDSEAERRVQSALARLLRGRTAFVVAHRLSTVRHADLILVLDKGRIVERGRHDDLMARGGLYAELATPQLLAG
ncbi:MAG TPA: ABC transporter ATP-binding protein, partial [Planctomycetota bacterium]|nr:ABC transporter ATP-binding protein [Planctomycetota bacterium]